MPNAIPGQQTGYEPGPGQISLDHAGSYDEWRMRVVADLVRRYTQGLGGLPGQVETDPELGRPSEEDFGTAKAGDELATYSWATVAFWERFVDKYGASSEFVKTNYGPPPDRKATYTPDPNSAGAITDRNIQNDRDARAWETGENDAQRDWESGESAAERANRLALQESGNASAERINQARIDADAREGQANRDFTGGQNALDRTHMSNESALDRILAREREQNETNRIGMQIGSNEKIALQNDILARWKAEGDWGVQKYVTELQEKGALERLKLQLNLGEKELAQRSVEAKMQHHEAMTGLVMEIAKYDSELAAQPVNWLKYAAWLKNRGQVVDGLNLAMAAEQVPEESIGPEEIAASGLPGANVAATQTFEERMMAGQQPQQTVTDPMAANPAAAAAQGQAAAASQTADPQASAPAYGYKGIDLTSTDYKGMLDGILGLNPNAAQDGVDNSQAAIQGTLDSLDVTGHQENGANPGFQQGLQVNGQQFQFNGDGTQVDYRKYAKLLPAQQQMHAGATQATGASIDDFLYKAKKTKPQGGSGVGATSYG